eukprot:snap_masked-scaffold_5-processed-gene-18.24-mRNA-1 protein AED:1.00 eAED:1.00 QI:0/-1/0/0/-1/1/1/0/162
MDNTLLTNTLLNIIKLYELENRVLKEQLDSYQVESAATLNLNNSDLSVLDLTQDTLEQLNANSQNNLDLGRVTLPSAPVPSLATLMFQNNILKRKSSPGLELESVDSAKEPRLSCLSCEKKGIKCIPVKRSRVCKNCAKLKKACRKVLVQNEAGSNCVVSPV